MSAAPGDGRTSIEALLDAFRDHGERPALTFRNHTWTFAEFRTRIFRTARALDGLGRGDVVALLTGNRPETYLLRYAAGVLGCCATVLYDDRDSDELATLVETAGATVLVHLPQESGRATAIAANVPGLKLLTPREDDNGDDLPVRARPEDVGALRLTGGSSGTPKWIPTDFRVPRYFAPAALAGWRDAKQLLCTPIGHLAGTLSEVVLAAGGQVVVHERFDAGKVLEAIERERITFLWLASNLLPDLLGHPALATTDTSSLTSLALGGWASSAHHVARAVERFGPIIAQGYGTNEVGQITWLGAEEHRRPELLTTVGKPVPGVEVSIRDDAGEPLETGETGEIWVRGPNLKPRYHRAPEHTAQVLRDGWFLTGDLGFLDAEGYLSVVGRAKEIIDGVAGRVYPESLENALSHHPGVRSSVAFGTPGNGRDLVCAAVVPADGHELSDVDLIAWLRDRRGDTYAPDVVLVLTELPATGSGKPDRTALRRLVTSS